MEDNELGYNGDKPFMSPITNEYGDIRVNRGRVQYSDDEDNGAMGLIAAVAENRQAEQAQILWDAIKEQGKFLTTVAEIAPLLPTKQLNALLDYNATMHALLSKMLKGL